MESLFPWLAYLMKLLLSKHFSQEKLTCDYSQQTSMILPEYYILVVFSLFFVLSFLEKFVIEELESKFCLPFSSLSLHNG